MIIKEVELAIAPLLQLVRNRYKPGNDCITDADGLDCKEQDLTLQRGFHKGQLLIDAKTVTFRAHL